MNYHKLQFDIDKRLDTLCRISGSDLGEVLSNYDCRLLNLEAVYTDFPIYRSHFMDKAYRGVIKTLNDIILNNCMLRDYNGGD